MTDDELQSYDQELDAIRAAVRTIDPAAALDGVYEFFPVEDVEPLAFLLAPYVVAPEQAPREPGLRGVITRWKRAARQWHCARSAKASRSMTCDAASSARVPV
jgi:hypothetical protein